MKKVLLSFVLALAACVSESEYGKCVGVAQADRRDPALLYDLSIWNVTWGVIGVEMVLPPILVLHHEMFCPTGRRQAPADSPKRNLLGETTR